ncbi:hypothetical protein BpHYR1_043872 [Brachionus plicatilis]|uniref:Uncharacterized protein n=1 Tax=Brachionus plicatilis TaxID=10195 RepID=A0A3M7QI06_BRAPC|nr:hypothetical protein BpHYR1_043872 [Brachionus plicatilis]
MHILNDLVWSQIIVLKIGSKTAFTIRFFFEPESSLDTDKIGLKTYDFKTTLYIFNISIVFIVLLEKLLKFNFYVIKLSLKGLVKDFPT